MTRVVETPQSHGYIGIARADITPPVGIYHRMWGAALHDRAEGVHRPLTATVLYFAVEPAPTAEQQQLFIALDHCLLADQEVAQILAMIGRVAEIPPECIALCFSHTHAAGLMLPDRAALPGGDLIAPYMQELSERVARLARDARDAARPSTIVYGTGRCELARHRDYWDEQREQFICGFNPGGGGDDTLLAARITADDGQIVGSVVNYACHPTTLAWDNRLISPDFPGATVALVERETGAPSVFLQGASGDLGPREGFTGDTEVAERNGRQLGYAALATLTALAPPGTDFGYQGPVVSGATIGVWRHEPISPSRERAVRTWQVRRCTIDLPYRPELPTRAETEAQRDAWQQREEAARAAGDEPQTRECRAMVERQTRMLARLEALPRGDAFPVHATLLRFGDAIWVAVQGEAYSVLQRRLRERFPEVPLVVISIAHSWGPSYLPPRETYGLGIYQESIAVLAAGSLEELTDALASHIQDLLGDDAA